MNLNLSGKNRQKYLVFVLVVAILAILFVFNKDTLFKNNQGEGNIFLLFEPQKIEINLDLLSSAKIRDLRMPQVESMELTDVKFGQENPFVSSK
jgi:hypothetical protein